MPRALYVSAGTYTAAAAGFGAAVPSPGDTFNVPNFIAGNGYLENVWANAASTDWVSVHSARMHDNNQGVRLETLINSGDPLMPWGAAQLLYSGDVPTYTVDQNAIASGGIASIYSFDDMPGVQPRLDVWANIQPRIENISGVEVDIGACGAIGAYSAGVAINSTFDNFQADSDYALLGYLTAANVLALAVVGQDTGNLKVGGPGVADPKVTKDFFIKMANETGRPCIPIIAANNKGGTLVSQVDSTAHAAQHVTLILAQLK
jgi:hypothetical protein